MHDPALLPLVMYNHAKIIIDGFALNKSSFLLVKTEGHFPYRLDPNMSLKSAGKEKINNSHPVLLQIAILNLVVDVDQYILFLRYFRMVLPKL